MEPESLRPNLKSFAEWRHTYLRGDEKGEAQTFLDRLFKAFGHEGAIEAGAIYEDRVHRRIDYLGVSYVDLMWKPRVLFEMKKAGSDLARHFRQAFDYWQQAVPSRPRYVVLCNFDEFWIYDFDQQLDAPMDVVKIDDLPQRFEALAFLLPEAETPIFENDLVEVTRDAAAKVSGVFRSMVDRGIDRLEAQRFVLQSVVAMFAEDIGLLPSHFFTRTVTADATNGREAYDLLGSLFREMNTPGRTSGGRFEGTPYFNGGLFADVQPVEMTDSELSALKEACTTDWSKVRPEIFGTLFETSMDKGERHAYGAHFTSQADIMKIVGPCIVQPWRERIDAAKTINDYERLLLDMAAYRVLDPACGSGNFLYVAYREMRSLEAEVKQRIDERRKSGTRDQTAFSYVTTDHFLGIDNNPFAVEVAKVTLMMGKKLASDELEGGQEDVLPLDNLDTTVVCADALFSPWPKADAIIGNPPYMGRRKMVEDLGLAYVQRLDEVYPNPGVSDFVTFWFPLAHDALPDGGRAGFVATQAIRDNASRVKSLDYVVENDGVIFDAVSSQPWSGDAVVTVSIVNWVKGSKSAPVGDRLLWLDEGQLRLPVPHIPATLRPLTDVTKAAPLAVNKKPKVCFQGQTTGIVAGYRLDTAQALAMIAAEPQAADVIKPMISGEPLIWLNGVPGYVMDVGESDIVSARHKYPSVMALLTDRVLPERRKAAAKEARRNEEMLAEKPDGKPVTAYQDFLAKRWWKHWRRRDDMLTAFAPLTRYIALTRVAAAQRTSIYVFVDPAIRPDDSLQLFALDDDYSFGVLSSSIHRAWFDERCSKLKADPRYTPTTVWDSFPWPSSPTPTAVAKVAEASKAIIDKRSDYLASGMTLGAMYDSLRDGGASPLRDLHRELDAAVIGAYGFNPDEDLLAQLLALNLAAADDPLVARVPGGSQFGESAYTTTYRLAVDHQ
ncbi:DNA methyltransferase [Nocardioides campestrisoli]|uniref:DNA methyltransferase n=1 Tax=Nocardioides campestrisoli TaxID=2736757 RepID=UPI00163D586F|nr:DNA methyltransferase [Nocardioides campestrisoli]